MFRTLIWSVLRVICSGLPQILLKCDMSDGFEQPDMVEPRDPFDGHQIHRFLYSFRQVSVGML